MEPDMTIDGEPWFEFDGCFHPEAEFVSSIVGCAGSGPVDLIRDREAVLRVMLIFARDRSWPLYTTDLEDAFACDLLANAGLIDYGHSQDYAWITPKGTRVLELLDTRRTRSP